MSFIERSGQFRHCWDVHLFDTFEEIKLDLFYLMIHTQNLFAFKVKPPWGRGCGQPGFMLCETFPEPDVINHFTVSDVSQQPPKRVTFFCPNMTKYGHGFCLWLIWWFHHNVLLPHRKDIKRLTATFQAYLILKEWFFFFYCSAIFVK